jgi:hypothetical protein
MLFFLEYIVETQTIMNMVEHSHLWLYAHKTYSYELLGGTEQTDLKIDDLNMDIVI